MKIISSQKSFYKTGKTKDIEYRKKYLLKLKNIIKKYEKNIMNALKHDLNKSEFEGYTSEISFVYEEIDFFLKNIKKFSKTKTVKTPKIHFISKSKIYKEPYGVVLIISPWNYPFQLCLIPLVGAIAAGNCAVIKPSEDAPATSNIINKIIIEVFEANYVSVFQGDYKISEKLLNTQFDYIFFTGSINIGKLVMEKASNFLTPITLELGGKSPCIVDETANIDLSAKRICWGKFLNAGQTCVAPDYILINKNIKDKFLNSLKKYIKNFYGDCPEKNQDYPKIINKKHFNRLNSIIASDYNNNLWGGKPNEQNLKISPCIIEDATWTCESMKDEIFGPILPIITFENLDEIIEKLNNNPKPLALYMFTSSKKNSRKIINNLSFGGGCINDTIIHIVTPNLPFGGVGFSGMGDYHGKSSFDTFSRNKSILEKNTLIDIKLRYPPFSDNLIKFKKLTKH